MIETVPHSTTNLSPLVEMLSVTAFSTTDKDILLRGFSCVLVPGEIAYIKMDRQRDPRALVSLFLGLQSPESGVIQYSGKDWFDTNYDMQFRMRSQIGRVYSSQGWVQNLTVGENIRIGPLHQGVSLSELEQSIANWISRLGGSSTSTVERAMNRRPAVVSNTILQVCQFVRAFVIEPKLLILESPTNYLTRELKDRFFEAVSNLCSHGSSVIWFDVDELPPSVQSAARIQRWMIVNDSLQVAIE